MIKEKLYRILIFILAIVLTTLTAGCTSENKDVSEVPGQAPPTGGELIFQDDFSDSNSGWLRESTESVERDYKNGEYYILLKKYNWTYWIWNRNAGVVTDFILNAEPRLLSGSNKCYYGLIFRRKDNDNFYRFLVTGDGNYFVGARLNGNLTTFQGWISSSYIKEGNNVNNLTVACKESLMKVYVNGRLLTTVTDDALPEGYIGLVVGTPESSSALVVFDNITIYSYD